MKKAVSLCIPIVLFSCFCLSAHARVIKGRVLDATTKQAVAYASVTVLSLPDSAVVVDHATTGDDGAFVLHKVKDGGDGYMRISSLGYCTRKLQVSAVDTLGTVVVMLQPDRKLLDEVVVLGQKKLVKLTHQGLSYSMADDPKCQAEDLLTAMRRVPMVTVDGVGRLTVKGGSNYTIYMNGHPFRIANQNPSQVLGSIPAANIQKVEIITNPDASYSAEAGTTIINIVTTGRKVLGQSLLLSLQAETKPKGNGSISYNLVTRPVKLSLAYDYDVSNEHKQPVAQLREATLPGLSSTLKGDARNEATFQHHTARLMLEAEIDSLNTIYADGHYRFSSTDYKLDWTKQYREGNVEENVLTKNKSKYQDGSFETNVFYKKLRRDKKEVFSAGYRFAYSPDVRSQEGEVNHDGRSQFTKNTSRGGLSEHTLQLDLTPVRKRSLVLKTGILGTLRHGKSHPKYYARSAEGMDWEQIDTARVGGNLRQTYYDIAGYLNASYSLKRVSLTAGARVEYSKSRVTRSATGLTTREHHVDLIPRVSLTYQPGNSTQIGLNYYSGVRRPSIWLLNPFVDKVDDFNTSMGNPDLKPQKTHNIGLSAMYIGSKTFAQLSLDYAVTRDPILKRRWMEPDDARLLYESYFNGKKYRSFVPSLWLNYRPTSRISINAFANVGGLFFYGSDGELLQKNFVYNVNTNVDVELPKSFYLGGNYGYTQSNPTLGSKSVDHAHIYSCYVTKRALAGKLSLSLTASFPFQKYSKFKGKDWGAGFTQYRTNWISARSFGFKLVYNMSIGDKSKVKRNTSLTTTDLERSTGVR